MITLVDQIYIIILPIWQVLQKKVLMKYIIWSQLIAECGAHAKMSYVEKKNISFNDGWAENLGTALWSMIAESCTVLRCTVCGKTKDREITSRHIFRWSLQ